MKTRVVEYQDDELDIKLTVAGPANTRRGMIRSLLIETEKARIEQERSERNGSEGTHIPDMGEVSENMLRTVYYPAFIAATIQAEGFEHWPISPEEFLELPEPLSIEWEKAVAELNPKWFENLTPSDEELKELEKKVTELSKESSTG